MACNIICSCSVIFLKSVKFSWRRLSYYGHFAECNPMEIVFIHFTRVYCFARKFKCLFATWFRFLIFFNIHIPNTSDEFSELNILLDLCINKSVPFSKIFKVNFLDIFESLVCTMKRCKQIVKFKSSFINCLNSSYNVRMSWWVEFCFKVF